MPAAQTLVPDVDLNPVTYVFSGSGPEGKTFQVAVTGSGVTIDDVVVGDWIVRADGLNAEGTIILTGSTAVTVEGETRTEAHITPGPVTGTGSMSIAITWNRSLTADPEVRTEMVDASGNRTVRTVPETVEGRAETVLTGLTSGYYQLSVTLLDGGKTAAGRVETVRIVAGNQTEVLFPFDAINKPGTPIRITTERFTIEWDPPPSDTDFDRYHIYYRPRGTWDWIPLTELSAADGPRLSMDASLLPYGTYEIAVSSSYLGAESDLHSSMDDTADPATGWYVEWIGPGG